MPLKLEITVGHVVRVEPHDPIVAGILEAEAAGISIEEYLKPIDRGVTPHELMEAVLCDCYLDEYAETRHEGQVHADAMAHSVEDWKSPAIELTDEEFRDRYLALLDSPDITRSW